MATSLKDLVGSVDWRKALTSSDARNALIGSALGGALLGGASLMQDRDPEESKFAPVGDALMGAVLGGVAGYGIPKGMALLSDGGSLAPDGDTLKSNYLGWGLGGAAAGTGVSAIALHKALDRARGRLLSKANKNIAGERELRFGNAMDARARGASPGVIKKMDELAAMVNDNAVEADSILSRYRRARIRALFNGDMKTWGNIGDRLSELKQVRNNATRGYVGFRDLMDEVAREPIGRHAGRPRNIFTSMLNRTWRKGQTGQFFTHGGHYRPRSLFGLFNHIPLGRGRAITLSEPAARAFVRGGKYALGGTALALLAHKLLGPSASSNYKG